MTRIQWRTEGQEGDGIIVGCNQALEWLLPWWWFHYRSTNNYPVTFVDFGMSKNAQLWCQKYGELIHLDLSDEFVVTKEQMSVRKIEKWEKHYLPTIWNNRKGWFIKPFAMLQTPYERTIWLDLDCQCRGSLRPLFDYCAKDEVVLAQEIELCQTYELVHGFISPGEICYNSGVIPYFKGSLIIQEWAERSLVENDQFLGDQHLLSRMIFCQKIPVKPLPFLYNWNHSLGFNKTAIILHWLSMRGKNIIRKQLEIMKTMFLDLTIKVND